MQVYQIHPEHGRHIAQTSVEAKANIAEGWKTITEKAYKEGIAAELKKKNKQMIDDQKAALDKKAAELDD